MKSKISSAPTCTVQRIRVDGFYANYLGNSTFNDLAKEMESNLMLIKLEMYFGLHHFLVRLTQGSHFGVTFLSTFSQSG